MCWTVIFQYLFFFIRASEKGAMEEGEKGGREGGVSIHQFAGCKELDKKKDFVEKILQLFPSSSIWVGVHPRCVGVPR